MRVCLFIQSCWGSRMRHVGRRQQILASSHWWMWPWWVCVDQFEQCERGAEPLGWRLGDLVKVVSVQCMWGAGKCWWDWGPSRSQPLSPSQLSLLSPLFSQLLQLWPLILWVVLVDSPGCFKCSWGMDQTGWASTPAPFVEVWCHTVWPCSVLWAHLYVWDSCRCWFDLWALCGCDTTIFVKFFWPDVVHISSVLWVLGAWYSGGSKSWKLCWEAKRGFSESKGLAGFSVLGLWVLGFWVLRFWVLTLGCWCLSPGAVSKICLSDLVQIFTGRPKMGPPSSRI